MKSANSRAGHICSRTLWLLLALVFLSRNAGGAEQPLQTDQGMLWQLQSPTGLVSHLYGTIHVGEPSVLALPTPVAEAFAEAQTLVVEVVITAADRQRFVERMRLGGGKRLVQLVGESLYARVLHAAHYRELDRPLSRLQPWAVAIMLFSPRPTGLPVLDTALQEQARRAAKKIVPLESLDEQLAVFEEMQLADQIDLLHEAVLASLEFDVYYGELLVAYLDRDLGRLQQLASLHLAQDTRLKQSLQVRLVEQRNQRMVERLVPLLHQQALFIAVGALHLPGPTGILQQLAERGFKVTARY